jgi:RimJ/RimL family protein N-acetyltransferase
MQHAPAPDGPVVLETDRLLLRRFTDADVDHLVDLDADPEVTHFITNGEPTPRETVTDEILPAYMDYYRRYPGYGFWAIIEKATGDFLGWFHLRPSPDHPVADEPELGYRLRRASWGQGYATEGSRALIDRAFAELGASRVFAETMAVNTASRRVMEKTGLRLVRTFHADWPVRIPGDEHGDVEYAITRDEWEADRRRSRTARGCVE